MTIARTTQATPAVEIDTKMIETVLTAKDSETLSLNLAKRSSDWLRARAFIADMGDYRLFR